MGTILSSFLVKRTGDGMPEDYPIYPYKSPPKPDSARGGHEDEYIVAGQGRTHLQLGFSDTWQSTRPRVYISKTDR